MNSEQAPAAADLHQLLEQITTGDYVRLDDQGSPPWFEQGVIAEVDAQHWRLLVAFEDTDTTTITDDAGRHYFLVEDRLESSPPRLLWQRGELYLGRELTASEVDRLVAENHEFDAETCFREMMENHESGTYKTAQRLACQLRQHLEAGGEYPDDMSYVQTMLDDVLRDAA